MDDHSAIAFLNAELQTGLTMSRIALHARREDQKSRLRANARKAYDAILHYLPGSHLTPKQAADLEGKLAQLRSELELLGEVL